MKRERLEELVESVRAIDCGCLAYLDWDYRDNIRAALLAVERETVERCAHRAKIWDSEPLSGKSIAEEIRSLLTEA